MAIAFSKWLNLTDSKVSPLTKKAGRECAQGDDGNILLVLEPGLVMACDRNIATNKELRMHGIEVIEVDGSKRERGRGSTHDMSCPITKNR